MASRIKVVVLAFLLAAFIQLSCGELDIAGEGASPEEDVALYIETSRHGFDPIHRGPSHEAADRVSSRMEKHPQLYFPLVEASLDNAHDLEAEIAALSSLTHPKFVEIYRDRIYWILHGYVTGGRKPLHEDQETLTAVGQAAQLYSRVARADEAWDLLPLIRDHPNWFVASSALESIVEIADPSIIEPLEEAVRQRMETQPEEYTDAKLYLDVGLKRRTDRILERHVDQARAAEAVDVAAATARVDGPPNEAIELRVSLRDDNIMAGDPVRLRIRIDNLRGEPIGLPSPFESRGDVAIRYKYKDEEKFRRFSFARTENMVRLDTLLPPSGLVMELELFYDASSSRLPSVPLHRSGNVDLYVEYGPHDGEILTSNHISFEVGAPDSDEAFRAWTSDDVLLLAQEGAAFDGDPEPQLRYIIETFPTSHYAGNARTLLRRLANASEGDQVPLSGDTQTGKVGLP